MTTLIGIILKDVGLYKMRKLTYIIEVRETGLYNIDLDLLHHTKAEIWRYGAVYSDWHYGCAY